MKIATLLLFSVMMLSPSATLFSSPQKDKPAEVDRAEQSLQPQKKSLRVLELSGAATEYRR